MSPVSYRKKNRDCIYQMLSLLIKIALDTFFLHDFSSVLKPIDASLKGLLRVPGDITLSGTRVPKNQIRLIKTRGRMIPLDHPV